MPVTGIHSVDHNPWGPALLPVSYQLVSQNVIGTCLDSLAEARINNIRSCSLIFQSTHLVQKPMKLVRHDFFTDQCQLVSHVPVLTILASRVFSSPLAHGLRQEGPSFSSAVPILPYFKTGVTFVLLQSSGSSPDHHEHFNDNQE